jgi:hypothetical protein
VLSFIYHNAECYYAKSLYAECRYAECHYTECCGAVHSAGLRRRGHEEEG